MAWGIIVPGLRFRLTWVSVTSQLCSLGLVPYLPLASVSSPVKWAKYRICQNKDEMRTCGTLVNGGMFMFNKYLLHVCYMSGPGLIALDTLSHLILPCYY